MLKGVIGGGGGTAADITVGTTTITGGVSGRILYDNNGVLGEVAQSAMAVGTATNLAGGAANNIPYQSGAGTTAFATGITVSAGALATVTASGTVTGGGATPFTTTRSGASIDGSVTNTLNTGIASWSSNAEGSTFSSLVAYGSAFSGSGVQVASTAGFYGSSTVGIFMSNAASGPLRFGTNSSNTEQVRILNTASANRYVTLTGSNGASPTLGTSAGNLAISSPVDITGALTVSTTVKSGGYTVATLPAGATGQVAYVTDQLTTVNAKGVAPTGGGAVVAYQYYNGSAWVGI